MYVIGGFDQEGNAIETVECISGEGLHEVTPMHDRTGSVKAIAHGGSIIAANILHCVEIFRRTRLNGDGHWTIIGLHDPLGVTAYPTALIPFRSGLVTASTFHCTNPKLGIYLFYGVLGTLSI